MLTSVITTFSNDPHHAPLNTNSRLENRNTQAVEVRIMIRFIVAILTVLPAIACASEALVTVEVTREVEVTRDVEVTREVEVNTAPRPLPICSDYPYMLALGELQLGYHNANFVVAERAISGAIQLTKAARDWFADRIATSRRNQTLICGGDFEPYGVTQREMNSFEGSTVCTETLVLLDDVYTINPDWDNTPPEVSEAWSAMLDGYINFCDNDFVFQE